MGRHSLAKERRKPPLALAALVAPAAVFFAIGGDVRPLPPRDTPEPVTETAKVAEDGPPCCIEIVAAAPNAPAPGAQPAASSAPAQAAPASRWRVVERHVPQLLPKGIAPEEGLQVKTILAARSISAVFPEILSIGGVRPDPLPWHPHGLAIDVMIPNPSSDEGIALGNQIVAYVLKNAERLAIQDAIWRGTYYTPSGSRAGGYGHYDHVHITTKGGGYPDGDEVYVR
ncbi:hypothetical protein [Mycobacterium hubeiense]|uniref:hypothetical protein n=1 Tax=Mycobacterium hubeiense TaxID=1867256 RepID=UPI000C7F6A51|nr:hypothetical protein [Mycobacterium sp. QGD 101]